MFVVSMLDPERFKLNYRPEMLIHYYSNAVMSTGNPLQVAEALKKIPFMVSIALFLDETVEFADIILPDTCYLERLEPFPNIPYSFMPGLLDKWAWQVRQPVVEPPAGVRPNMEIFIEIARAAGFLEEFYLIYSQMFLRGENKINPKKEYSWP